MKEANGLRNRLVHEYNGLERQTARISMEEINDEMEDILTKVRSWIKKDFAWVRKDSRVLSVLLFGSTVTDMHHRKSDIDLALVAPGLSHFYYSCKNISNESVNASDLLRKVFRKVNTSIRNYDVHLFEELPLNIQINSIHHHKIVYTADKPGMFEYFYHYRKRWDDQKHRNTVSKDQLISSL